MLTHFFEFWSISLKNFLVYLDLFVIVFKTTNKSVIIAYFYKKSVIITFREYLFLQNAKSICAYFYIRKIVSNLIQIKKTYFLYTYNQNKIILLIGNRKKFKLFYRISKKKKKKGN